MLPHIMFHHVYEHHRQDFNQMFLGTNDPNVLPNVLPQFWQELALRRDPRLQHHPMFGTANWHTRAIPISLHGDAVPVIRCTRAGSESFDTYSWMSILGEGTTLYLKQYLFGLFNAMKTADTMTPVWEEICWSLKAPRTCYLQAAELGCESQCHRCEGEPSTQPSGGTCKEGWGGWGRKG